MQQILFQYWPPADSQPYTAGTVPALKQWIIHALTVTNLVREDIGDTYAWVKYKIHIVKSGEATDVKNCLAYYPSYLPWESVHKYEWIRLSAWDYVVIFCISWRIAVQWFGEEIDADVEVKYEQALDSIIDMWPDVDTIADQTTIIAWCVCP